MSRDSRGIAILHVDDDPDFVDLAAELIERQDARLDVETAASASDGLDRLAETSFDCVVSDYDMPGLNGIEFLEAARESAPNLPFILYTGKGSEEVASDAISAGVTDYLQKESGTSQYDVLANRIINAVEQQRTREEASYADERLWTIAENTNDSLWMFNADWSELLFVNSAHEEIWGQSLDNLREDPTSFVENVHPEDRDRVKEAMAHLSAGESIDIEYRVNETENFGRWVWVKGKPVFDDAEEVKWIVGFTRDDSGRKEREREHQQYEMYLEHVNDVITVFDMNGEIRYESPSVEHALGYDPEERIGENGLDYIHPEDLDALESYFENSLDSPSEQEDNPPEIRVRHRDGSWRWFEVRSSVHLDDPVGGVIASSRDITERKQREQEHQKIRERTEFALRETDTVIWTWDTETSEFRTLYQSLDEVLGRKQESTVDTEDFLQIVVHADDRPKVNEAFEQFRQGDEERFRVDFRTNPEVSKQRWLRTIGYQESDPDSSKIVGLLSDVTEQKQREAQLGDFASVVSHDLQNPLMVAQGRLELAQEECETVHHTMIESALERMEGIITDVLRLAREGRHVDSVEPVDVREAVDSAWTMIADHSNEATLLYAGGKRALPVVLADFDRLRQLLENVLANALTHGGDDVTVTVGALVDGFYIEDDGPGIPEAARAEVFEAGYSTATDGTGFGLAIVKQVADAHDWDIRVTEGHEGGARFEIIGMTFPEQ